MGSTSSDQHTGLRRGLTRISLGLLALATLGPGAVPAASWTAPNPDSLPDSSLLGFDSGPTAAYVAGFKWRKTFDAPWATLEPARGQYDWRVMDRLVGEAQTHGQKLMWLFWVPPPWAASDWRSFMPDNPQDLTRFLEAFWDRYAAAGVIGAIEVWGEANINRTGQDTDPDEYVQLARIVSEVTKRKAPGVVVLGGAMSSGWWEAWARSVFDRDLLSSIDAFSWSRYAELADSNPTAAVGLVMSINQLRTLMAEYGNVKPIWITEAGLGTVPRQGSVIPTQDQVNSADEAYGLWPGEPWRLADGHWRSLSEQRAAGVMVRAAIQSLAYGVKRLTWFRYHYAYEPWFSWFIDGSLETPKLLVNAHEVLSAILVPGTTVTVTSEALNRGDGTDVYVYSLQRPADRGMVVWRQIRTNQLFPWLWAPTLRSAPISVTLPVIPSAVQAVSLFGHSIPATVSGTNVAVEVGDDPVFVLYTATASPPPSSPPPNQPPTIIASATPKRGRAPLTVAFVANGTDPEGGALAYRWSFGDGSSSTERNPQHVYQPRSGERKSTFTATVTVTDDRGATASIQTTIVVQR